MKIYIMTDMEGVCGIEDFDNWVVPTGKHYDEGKRLLTLEANAAVDGFIGAGATELLVVDGHGYGGLDPELLDKRATLALPSPQQWPFLLDPSFDAVAFVGQHAKAGSEYAHLPHTGHFGVLDCQINGISVGEFGQFVLCAATMGVLVIFASGDDALTQEAEALVKGIEAVAVKKGLTPGSGDECNAEEYRCRNIEALHMPLEQARELIRERARSALGRLFRSRDSFRLPKVQPPFKMVTKHRGDSSDSGWQSVVEDASDIVSLLNAS